MRVLFATNEPWGTYHTEPLVPAATAAGMELAQWCPSLEHVPAWPRVQVVTNLDTFDQADLVAVNGIASQHTLQAVHHAPERDIPIAFVELAFLTPIPPLKSFAWSVAISSSQASAAVVAVCAGVAFDDVRVLGWPGLGTLPDYQPVPRHLAALTSVSQGSKTGGGASDANDLLYEALCLVEQDWDITVRTHPREAMRRWTRWKIDQGKSPASLIATAAAVIAPVGTATMYTAALGVPCLGIHQSGSPDYLVDTCHLITTSTRSQTLLADLIAPEPATCEKVTGPVGGAAERIIQTLIDAV